MAHSSPGPSSPSPRVSIGNSGYNSPITPGSREWTNSKATHLPFRRISLTPAPATTLFNSSVSSHRVSVASAGSFDSMPEDEAMSPPWTPGSDKLGPPRTTSRLSERPKLHRRPSSSGSISSIELGTKMRLGQNIRPSRSQRSRSRIAANRPLEDAHNAKRLKVMQEMWETEKAYVEGLELVYSHFLTPLISSLSEPTPLLSRADLTTIFSNFVDIWNLHHSLLSHLDEFFLRIYPAAPSPSVVDEPITSEPSSRASTRPSSFISASSSESHHQQHQHQHHHAINDFLRILISHFPYLSMYNPFVTAFPSSLSLLTALSTPPPTLLQSAFPRPSTTGPGVRHYEPRFAAWLKEKEADPVCRRLKLRDWMLTVIQRCPRYLLLIKELLGYTSMQDPEYRLLLEVTSLITKVTNSLNQSLAAHAQIMSLISLQRSTPNLPFSLIVPGRTLLRRGTVMKVDRGSDRRLRDLLLFSDCLIWISRGGEREDWGVIGEWASAGLETGQSVFRESLVLDQSPAARSRRQSHGLWLGVGQGAPPPSAPGVRLTGRTRSRSDADTLPVAMRPSSSTTNLLPSPDPSLLRSTSDLRDDGTEDKWWYRGRAELLDVEIVVAPIISAPGEERMLEVMSPEGSFALYSESQAERDAWVHAIRAAKAARLASFQVTHPDTTLTSSNSNAHVRRALQALPHDPAEASPPPPLDTIVSDSPTSRKSRKASKTVRRAKVEHFVPAIWVPDQKTETCMRCNSRFGWRRRRHHCRLCGRVVCASCSNKTFYITDANDASSSSTPARACEACFESVFPIVSQVAEQGTLKASASVAPQALHKAILSSAEMRPTVSMPTLALAIPPHPTPTLTTSTSKTSFGSRIRGASFLRGKRTSREKTSGESTTIQRPPSLSRAHSTTSTISSSSGFVNNDSGSASISTDDGSHWLSSTGGSSGAAFPASLPDSPTSSKRLNKETFPAIDTFPSSSTVLSGNNVFLPATPIIQHAAAILEDENGTVGPRRSSQDRHSRLAVREMAFDPDITPRPTARKQDRPWSCGDVPAPSLPMPNFNLSPAKQSVGTSLEDASDTIAGDMHLPDVPADDTLRALSPRARRSSLQVLQQDSRAPPRGYKKRVSIAPFPNPAPQALPIHDAPVTARTRVQGDGSSRRYSLVLGGTMRGPPVQNPMPATGASVNGAVEAEPTVRIASHPKVAGAWNAEDARQATRGDVDAPSSRSYSLRNGVAITKLAELLGRDRHHNSR